MSKLDEIFVDMAKFDTERLEVTVDDLDVWKKHKREIKKLILDEFKAAEYDPWAFTDRIEKL